jgi:antitoxin CptB
MAGESDKELQRLRWHCRRGLLELDCLFEDYVDQRYLSAGAAERAQFRQLLNEQDPDLQAWLLYGEPCPEQYQAIVSALRNP